MKFLKDIFIHYIRSNTFEKGAALSYYTAFSFLPITVIITSVLGLIFKEEIISGELYTFLEGIIGDKGAVQFEDIIGKQHLFHHNVVTSIIGVLILMLTATGMFNQIHNSFNAIWGLKVRAEKSIINYFARRISSLLVLMLIGFYILLSTSINTFIIKYSSSLPNAFKDADLYEHLISFVLITLLFSVLFKIVGNAIVHWKTAIVSAGFTSVLFFLGKIAIGTYIAHSNITSTFGTASVLALLMIWVYYTSQILFIGASFAYVFGQRTGHEIKPTSQVVRYVQKELR